MGDYSEKEKKIFEYFQCWDLKDHVEPPTLYDICMRKAFIENDQSVYSESLRRCINAFSECKILRMSEEWDDLIQIEEK